MSEDPFLRYITEILMEDGDNDDDDAAAAAAAAATCMQQVDDVSYEATFRGFYDILGEHLQPNSRFDSDPHVPHQRMCPYPEKEAAEEHVKVANPSDGLINMINEPHILGASAICNCHRSQEATAEVGFALEHDSSFQGQVTVSHTPSNTPERKYGMSSSASSIALNDASVPLSCDYDTVTHNDHNAINLNNGVLTDAMVSCWGKDHAAVEGPHDHRHMRGLEQGNDIFTLGLMDEDLASKLAETEVSFEDLKLNDIYTDLYIREVHSAEAASRDSKHSGDEKKSSASKGSKTGKKRTLQVPAFVDVREVLVSCAQAVAIGDARRTHEILQELRKVHGASANGTSLQRIAHFFSMALAARMSGIGEHQFREMSHKVPAGITLLKATKAGFDLTPFFKVTHFFANQSIVQAAEGVSRLHIVDYGLMYGTQWPCLISALADRKGGPPLLVITGIEFPQPGLNPAKRLEESGRQLAAYAKTYNVPFQYQAVVFNKLGDLDVASLSLHEGEFLIVNCIRTLCHVSDESVDLTLTTSPRQKLLNLMRSLNPHLLLTGLRNATYNSAFFVSRFREALYCFSNAFDMVETLLGDTPQRLILERSCFYRELFNVVGCEGLERVVRPETYKQWHARIVKAGFEQLAMPSTIVARSRSHVNQHYHKDYFIHDDGKGWMLMGWKGCTRVAVSAWKPSLV